MSKLNYFFQRDGQNNPHPEASDEERQALKGYSLQTEAHKLAHLG